MNKVSLESVNKDSECILIDVREPMEFKEFHLPNAINIPSTSFQISQFQPYIEKNIVLVCQSGNRSEKIAEKLFVGGFKKVSILDKQMAQLSNDTFHKPILKGWTVDRQFRMTLGVLLVIFLIGDRCKTRQNFFSSQFLILLE